MTFLSSFTKARVFAHPSSSLCFCRICESNDAREASSLAFRALASSNSLSIWLEATARNSVSNTGSTPPCSADSLLTRISACMNSERFA